MALKVLELFGGIGACSKALERLDIDYEIADYVEIDKYAVKSFNAIHNTNFEPQDICEWDKDIDVDLIMHGSPCQDFSLAGKQAGGDEGSGTRSSLMYETIRIVEKLKPKYVIWENVKNIISKKHKHNFDNYVNKMSELGYKSYYQVLNAKNYGVPQNRERVFTVSILGNIIYDFPNGDENNNDIKRLFNFSKRNDCRVIYDKNGLSPTLVAGAGMGGGKVPMLIDNFEFPNGNEIDAEVINPLKDISGKSSQFEQNVYSEDSILRSLKAGGGSGNIPKIIENFEFPEKQELKLKLKDILEDEVDEKYYLDEKITNKIKYKFKNEDDILGGMQGGWRQPCVEEPRILDDRDKGWGVKISDICPTQRATISGIKCITSDLRIRKLTPKECWRLMGFDDEDFEKAEKVNSNTQLYKQAGNSIVVNVLEAIFKNLLQDYIDDFDLSDLD